MTPPATNGHPENRTYDRAGRLTEVETAQGTTVLSGWEITRDPAGRPTRVNVVRAGQTDQARLFGYDPNGRLTGGCLTAATATDCAGGQASTYT